MYRRRSCVKFLDRLQPLSLLGLRVVLGIIYLYHGYPKLTHTRGNLQAVFVEHGLPAYFVYVAGILETFGGGLLLLGLFTRLAGLLLATEMCVAIWKVHSLHGIYAVRDNEFPLTLAAACFVLATVGAGLISLDHPIFEGGPRGGANRGSGKPRAGRGRED
jgi:putative oxidoreductase